MGTRSEIYIRDVRDSHSTTIELWKHWDSYESEMVPLFKEFAKFAVEAVAGQTHWLGYPQDVAAMLIAFAYTREIKNAGQYKNHPTRPDIRPRGDINDLEYVWILDVPEWRLTGYKTTSFDLSDSDRQLIREGEESAAAGLSDKQLIDTVLLDVSGLSSSSVMSDVAL